MSDDKIIPFPKREADKFYARCPECGGFSWELQVDSPDVEKILAFHCANEECGYTIPLVMHIELKNPDNEQVFSFEPDFETDEKFEFRFELEDDDDERDGR